jgi:hypothetical protein
MIRNLKVLRLAALAVCALSAFSAASASAAEFHSSVEHTILDGTQIGNDVFTTNAGTVSCADARYDGTITAKTTKTITGVTPTYSECTAFGFTSVPIDHNECTYDYHTTAVAPPAPAANYISITCPTGKVIEVTEPNCTVTVGPQNLAGVAYTTEGKSPKRDVKVTVNIVGITYTQDGRGFFPCTAGTFTNGTYKGESTVIGRDTTGNQVDVWYL